MHAIKVHTTTIHENVKIALDFDFVGIDLCIILCITLLKGSLGYCTAMGMQKFYLSFILHIKYDII